MNPEVIDKLRKLLKLAQDKGAQPGEVENALAKAKEISVRRNIELAGIDLNTDKDGPSNIEVVKDSSVKTRSKNMRPYHKWIFRVLHEVFQVEVLYNRFGSMLVNIHIIGEPTDVVIAVAMFPYLEHVFASTYNQHLADGSLSHSAADMNGCFYGICKGIVAANKREEAKIVGADAGKYALVLRRKEDVIQQKINEMFPKVKQSKDRSQGMSQEGLVAGVVAGRKVNLRQVPTNDTNKLKG